MKKCESCDGTGTTLITGFITRRSGCSAVKNEPMKCFDCYGAGEVSDLTLKMRRIGKYIGERRREMDLSQREQAKILGLDFIEFNNIIRGKI